ncbi:MAG TPA: mechanosensitive ion channel domain-containing protein, partial [Cyanophyceae cyanobacterium]
VTVDTSKNLPIIQIDGTSVLTVTPEDVPPGKTAKEQADIWAGRLEQALEEARKQRSPGYIRTAILLSFGVVVLAIAGTWVLGWLWNRWLKPFLSREPRDDQNARPPLTIEVGVQIILTSVRVALWLFAALYITNLFPQTRELSRKVTEAVVSSLVSKLIPLGESSFSVLDILILVGLFTSLIILARSVKKLLRSRVLLLTGLSRGSQETVAIIATYTFTFLGSIVILQLWGLNLSSLTLFAGVLGVGIGLGLQGVAKEFISGLVLIFERPIQVGDFVKVGESMGTVERISVRSTEIRTLDAVSIIIPNSRFLEGEVVNWTHNSPVSRIQLPIGIAYGTSLSDVQSALMEITKDYPGILSQPAPKVLFRGFKEDCLHFDLLVWINEPSKQFTVKSDLYFRLEPILRDRNIQLPVPQQDVHIRSGTLPVEMPPQLSDSLAQLSSSLAKWLEIQSNSLSQDKSESNNSPDGE